MRETNPPADKWRLQTLRPVPDPAAPHVRDDRALEVLRAEVRIKREQAQRERDRVTNDENNLRLARQALATVERELSELVAAINRLEGSRDA